MSAITSSNSTNNTFFTPEEIAGMKKHASNITEQVQPLIQASIIGAAAVAGGLIAASATPAFVPVGTMLAGATGVAIAKPAAAAAADSSNISSNKSFDWLGKIKA